MSVETVAEKTARLEGLIREAVQAERARGVRIAAGNFVLNAGMTECPLMALAVQTAIKKSGPLPRRDRAQIKNGFGAFFDLLTELGAERPWRLAFANGFDGVRSRSSGTVQPAYDLGGQAP